MSRTHGIASTYRNRPGCRCEPCRTANTTAAVAEKASRKARLAADPTLAPHSSVQTYINWGCRCEPCTKANTVKCAAYKQRVRKAATA